VGFLTWDHPMITGAMELLLGRKRETAPLPCCDRQRPDVLLELIFVLEVIAAPSLHADRFLSPTPVRVIISHKLVDVTETFLDVTWGQKLEKGSPYKLIENTDIARRTLPAMFTSATALAETRADKLRSSALTEMNRLLGHEVERLQSLARVNDHVRPRKSNWQRPTARTGGRLAKRPAAIGFATSDWKGPPETLNT